MEWKDIPDFEGYQVSDTGLVRTHNKITYTEHHGARHWQDRILKFKNAEKSKRNQARVDLWKDGKPHCFVVARLVAFTFFGADINDHSLTVNHIDGNWHNNDLRNLELISLAANIKHGFENGLYHTCNKTRVINKLTGEKTECRSEADACRVIGKSHSYINVKRKQGKNENEKFRWESILRGE